MYNYTKREYEVVATSVLHYKFFRVILSIMLSIVVGSIKDLIYSSIPVVSNYTVRGRSNLGNFSWNAMSTPEGFKNLISLL